MAKTSLRIDGMSCDRCGGAVAAALENLPGVSRTEVSVAEGRAVVEHAEAAPTRDQLLAAVEEQGCFAAVE